MANWIRATTTRAGRWRLRGPWFSIGTTDGSSRGRRPVGPAVAVDRSLPRRVPATRRRRSNTMQPRTVTPPTGPVPDGIGGERADVGGGAGGVVEHRGDGGGAGALGTGGVQPGVKPPGLAEHHRNEPGGAAANPASTVRASRLQRRVEPITRQQGQDGEGHGVGLTEAGREGQRHHRPQPVPTAGPSPPRQDHQQRAGRHVEGVGGNGRTAEPGERRGGHQHPGGQSHPRPTQVASGHAVRPTAGARPGRPR